MLGQGIGTQTAIPILCIHPDSNQLGETEQDTGLVYQAGDLVAVAATDRNGDASFMVFTEAPGMTYDYETGAIVAHTDKAWEGPSNLHTEEGKADDVMQDNEKFYGWDAEGREEVMLKDSVSGDNTFYWKRSSNQGLNQGEGQDDGTRYPILNNAIQLDYPGQNGITQDAGTVQKPTGIYERPIRQKVQVEKNIQTLQETKVVWYCLNCGYENQEGVAACCFCGRARTTAETGW